MIISAAADPWFLAAQHCTVMLSVPIDREHILSTSFSLVRAGSAISWLILRGGIATS